jgi:hypothetical protein
MKIGSETNSENENKVLVSQSVRHINNLVEIGLHRNHLIPIIWPYSVNKKLLA